MALFFRVLPKLYVAKSRKRDSEWLEAITAA
jgi:hypothetical protein